MSPLPIPRPRAESTHPRHHPRHDGELVYRLRRFDDTAYEELVDQNAPALLALARRLLPSREDAEDVVQEAFVSVFRGVASFRGGCAVSTWLHRITVNHALMRLREHHRRRRPAAAPAWTTAGDRHHCPPRPWRDSPAEAVARADLWRHVCATIEGLPDVLRRAVRLRYVEDMELRDIAVRLDISVNAVKIRVHRGRRALGSLLDPELCRS